MTAADLGSAPPGTPGENAARSRPVLECHELSKDFAGAGSGSVRFRALDRVSLEIRPGEVLAVVGESGSGKTTLVRCLLGIEQPSSGSVIFDGVTVRSMRGRQGQWFRRQVQAVFQDPYSSLDPRWTARRTVREALDCLRIGTRGMRNEIALKQLARVGLSGSVADKRPAALSGGQRQRVVIAAALASNPRLLIADEPVTALDVSVQAQVLNQLSKLRRDMNLAILLVSHNLAVVSHISDRVVVMRRGQVVEAGMTAAVLDAPSHPYTKVLIEAIPRLGSRLRN